MPLTNPVPGPPASVLTELLTTDPVNPPQAGDTNRAVFSGAQYGEYPLLPSLVTDVVWMPQYGVITGNLEIQGMLVFNGWATEAVTSVTGNYTALPTDAVILASASGGALTVTLPDATQPGFSPGQRYTVIKTDNTANVVTVTGSAGQLINSGSVVSLTAANSETSVVFDGVTTDAWWVWAGVTTVTISGGYLRSPTIVNSGTFTTSSGTFSAISSGTVATGSFTAPASGEVIVEVDLVANSSAATSSGWALAATGTVTPIVGKVVAVQQASSTPNSPYHLVFPVTGLTSGSAYSLDVLFAISGGNTVSAFAVASTGTTISTSSKGAPIVVAVKAV